MMNFERWQLLMKQFGFADNKATYDSVVKHYSENHRAYHNTKHISDCLGKLDSINKPIPLRKEIELAIWFHDIIYNPYGKENELKSAKIAVKFLEKQNSSDETKSIVFNLIMATLHKERPSNDAEKVIMDIDISILGTDYKVYKAYSNNIRREYKMVPKILYRKKRREILSSFLKRDQLYYSDYFHSLEVSARNNLKSEIMELGQ